MEVKTTKGDLMKRLRVDIPQSSHRGGYTQQQDSFRGQVQGVRMSMGQLGPIQAVQIILPYAIYGKRHFGDFHQ